MILVAGATGLLGGAICRQLRQAGKPVRALARPTSDPAKLEQLKGSGATLVQADLNSLCGKIAPGLSIEALQREDAEPQRKQLECISWRLRAFALGSSV
jgi:nucleoside-diphosphate-sugar epimerase